MVRVPLHIAVDDPAVVEGLARIREEQHVPGPHDEEAVAEATAAAARALAGLDAAVASGERRDARDVEFVTVDPPGSRDLDQALHLSPLDPAGDPGGVAGGWRVRYAIADVAAFVAPGGALDRACWDRGFTHYLPDGRAPLHPAVLGEEAGSLLPDQDRPAVLWTVDLDGTGAVVASSVERAVVRSRAQLTYAGAQADLDGGRASPSLALLPLVGAARRARELARGGTDLDLPAQRVEAGDGGYRIEFEATLPVEGWNAQISLLVGMVAAERMVRAGVGLLRTLPPPGPDVEATVRRTARALGVTWPPDTSYAAFVGGLRSTDPDEAALLALAARGLRGAGYLALPSADATGDALEHAAVAAPYAHVTAPLRRLGDRYATEACLAAESGTPAPAWVTDALPDLPAALNRAGSRESSAVRAAVDLVEALILVPLVGHTLDVTVVSTDGDSSTVVARHPALQARVPAALPLGEELKAQVTAADPISRQVTLTPL